MNKGRGGGAPALRPARLVLVAGTATGVGKTWVAARVLAALRSGGASVAARKPVQSFAAPTSSAGPPTDAEVLAAATGEGATDVCPPHRWYERAMAPPMAADVLGRPAFTLGELVEELRWPAGLDLGVVEGVGGPRSPLAGDGDTVALAATLRPDSTVLVASAGLGAINAVLLSVAALPGPAPVVLLNRYRADDALHGRNAAWLRARHGLDVVTSVEELVSRWR